MQSRTIARGVFIAAVILGIPIAAALDAPRDNKGYTTTKTTFVDLGPEIEGMAGRQLRLRALKIEPGRPTGLHSHKDRPSVVYFLQGTDTVIRDDGSSQTFHAGDVTAEPSSTVHWHRNDGQDAVVLVTADIFKTGK